MCFSFVLKLRDLLIWSKKGERIIIVVLVMIGNKIYSPGFYFGYIMALSRIFFKLFTCSLHNITDSETSVSTGQYGILWCLLALLKQWLHLVSLNQVQFRSGWIMDSNEMCKMVQQQLVALSEVLG